MRRQRPVAVTELGSSERPPPPVPTDATHGFRVQASRSNLPSRVHTNAPRRVAKHVACTLAAWSLAYRRAVVDTGQRHTTQSAKRTGSGPRGPESSAAHA